MKVELGTHIIDTIVPDTYGSELCYEINGDYIDELKQLMIELAEETIKDMLSVTIAEEANLIMGEFVSPHYYNFETDRIYFTLDMKDNIIDYIKENVTDEFFDWAKQKYHSCDGFISFMPYEKEKFYKTLDKEFSKYDYKKELAIAMFINYQIHQAYTEDELDEIQREYIEDVYEKCHQNGYIYYEEAE